MSDASHWEGCWENENHPLCRLARIHELGRELAVWRTSYANHLKALPDFTDGVSETVWCGGDDTQSVMYPKTPFVIQGTVTKVVVAHPDFTEGPVVIPIIPDRIPGSASWTMPAVDEPPVVADPLHPVSRHPQGNV